jgi:hypothetical protein
MITSSLILVSASTSYVDIQRLHVVLLATVFAVLFRAAGSEVLDNICVFLKRIRSHLLCRFVSGLQGEILQNLDLLLIGVEEWSV